ncbi:MAG: carbon-nitrogen hydrolase family protein [Acetobacteraceae bacterium]|nr:carbon-nitrogen hydrolase family protein [Acetobacteraceae bacterium]
MRTTGRHYLAAVVQMVAGRDPEDNLGQSLAWLEEAAARGASVVVFPETFTVMGRAPAYPLNAEPPLAPGTVPAGNLKPLAEAAARLKILVVAGVPELPGAEAGSPTDQRRVYNAAVVLGPEGTVLGVYRKVHLFDADLPGGFRVRESETFLPGDAPIVLDTPLGRLGLAICYDLRFPEFMRALAAAGAEVIALPSAFTLVTGRDHWEPLLRARAIENQVYILAAEQYGCPEVGPPCLGRSMIVDPWGTVLASAPDRDCLICAEVDLDRAAEVRSILPCWAHRRPEVYGKAPHPG